MDKYEYKVRAEEISNLIDNGKYIEAVAIADTIDWRKVKSATMLLKIAALYRVNRRNEDSREILLLAHEHYPTNRSVVYSLCELSIELDDVVSAIEYYKQFAKLAPKDNGVYTLRYRILEAQEASLEERIEILEELKRRDYQEEWAYELAYLYHRVGLTTKCVEECDDIILWFGEGPYVMKAMELKALHVPLTDVQQAKYESMLNHAEDDFAEDERENDPDIEYYQPQNDAAGDFGAENAYVQEDYQEEAYAQEGYAEETYADGQYAQEGYADGQYAQNGYVDDGYGNLSYIGDSYPEHGYTGTFYVDQAYDENGYPMDSGTYAGEASTEGGEGNPGDGCAQNYNTSSHPQESYASDMSQYNTINLQKVVAESMKELFPDDEVFEEEREKFSIEEEDKKEDTGGVTGDTIVYANLSGEEPPAPESVPQMVAGVSETAPEPHAGAVSKVIVPGADARFMMADPDVDEPEANPGNVHDTQSPADMEAEAADEDLQETPAGPMNLNEVLEEWERKKLDNARKHQEEIKQHVLTQTGKILANFDNSIKSGILGELEREEAQDEAANDVSPKSGTDSPRSEQESEEDFDVAYTADADASGEGGTNPGKEYLSELERVVAQELGGLTQDIPQPDAVAASDGYAQEVPAEDGYAEGASMEESPEGAPYNGETDRSGYYGRERYAGKGRELDPEDEEDIAEMAKEDALKTQEIKMSTADLSSLSDKIVAATKREAKGAKREEIRDFTPEEQTLFENFAVTKKIKKQIIFALENMTLAAYTGNVIITGDAGLDTVRMAKNLIREYHAADANFSGKAAKITGEKINQRNLKDVFDKLNNGGIIIEKANGMSEQKLYEMALLLNQDNLGIIIVLEDTKKEIARLLGKQAMIADYFNIRIDLMEMDINALVAYAKNYALALEYSIDELGTLALYTRIANMQSGNHVVTKDEVRDIVDEAIWKSKKSKIKNFVDVLFARRYDGKDMIVLKERDFI